jgi:hypothetical protein
VRVVDRKTFLALPPGTAYCKGEPWCFEGLAFKGETCGTNDWWRLDPAWVEGEDSGQCFDRLEEMRARGASYPMQASEARDGLFDAGAIFLVMERDDLLTLRGWIDAALSVSA